MQRLSTLHGLSFGKDDAAMEAKQGFLDKVFLKTSFYHRVRTGQRFLVTGRKGTGKSAICLSLKKSLESEGKSTIFVTSRLLSVPKMEQIKGTSINDQERFESSWRYVFLVKVALSLIQYIDNLKEYEYFDLESDVEKKLKEIREFLLKNKEIDKSFLRKVISFFDIFSKFSAKLPGGIEAGVETRQVEVSHDISNMLDKIEESLVHLSTNLTAFNLTILVDEVDDVWDSSQESKPLIIGLLNAIRKTNSSFGMSVVIVAFLRSDIWDGLSFADKDKFRSDDERISWSDEDLKLLIATRGRISANLFDIPMDDVDSIWKSLFDEKVDGQDSFQYIVDRTLQRPREVIQFCNLALSIAQDSNKALISQRDIKSAEARYSTWKLDDLVNEFKVQYPFLGELLLIVFQGFNKSFSKERVNTRYDESRKLVLNKFPELLSLDIDLFLQLLFAIGFLGVKIGGSDIYAHDDPDRPRIILANLENIETFLVHPAFHLALGLRRNYIIQNSTRTVNFVQNMQGPVNINNGLYSVGNNNVDVIMIRRDFHKEEDSEIDSKE
jgi:hypothetical protein